MAENYIINSCFLDADLLERHIRPFLDLYAKGCDTTNSTVVKWGRRAVNEGRWWYGCEGKQGKELEACIILRQQEIITLFKSIKRDGYNGSIISIYFNKHTGKVNVYDGFHRLSIMNYLGIKADCNCTISHYDPTREDMRGDFPLTDRLKELNSGEYLYEPCEDTRVSGWTVWRPDSEARLRVVRQAAVAGSVLDVGCSCGWFSRQLAREGRKVTSLELNKQRAAVARYLAITQNTPIELREVKWQALPPDQEFDNILMLSVLHHDFIGVGASQTLQDLAKLRGRCKRLIIEVPLSVKSVVWLKTEQEHPWNFTLDELSSLLTTATGMKVQNITYVHPTRPIIVLEPH